MRRYGARRLQPLVVCFLLIGAGCSGTKSVKRIGGMRWDAEGLYPIEENGKTGFVDRSGKVVIPAQFEMIGEYPFFSEGLVPIRLGETGVAYMDRTGKVAFRLAEYWEEAGHFSDGLAWVGIRGECKYINRQGAKIQTSWPDPVRCRDFSEGLAAVWTLQGWGYLDTAGKWAISPKFYPAQDFSEGLAAVGASKGKIGYIDRAGRMSIDPQFDEGEDFSEGLAAIRVGGKWGFIDKSGRIVIKPQWDRVGPFWEGLAAVSDAKTGYIDKTGKMVIPQQLDDAGPFSEGLAPASLGGRWGYVDKSGRFAISPQFEATLPFLNGGLAIVRGSGYIDTSGKFVWRFSR